MTPNKLIAWFITDNKPGHRNQLEGLKQALGTYMTLEERWVSAGRPLYNIIQALHLKAIQHPQLLVACGHRTHILALILKQRFGGSLIVLMRPSLPLSWFDLCVLPEHDPAPQDVNVLRTHGVLNAITPASTLDPSKGLVLIGGPSKHHLWDNPAIITQLRHIKNTFPQVDWILTTSRRTPSDFNTALTPLIDEHFTFVPVEQTPNGWLQQQMQHCARVWVSEDSVSMVYESLSSGAQVGLLSIPRRHDSRVSAGIDKLIISQQLTSVEHLVEQGNMLPAQSPLREADRVAKYILKQSKL